MNKRNILFIDLETTGLDPSKHVIIEAAWRVTSPDARTLYEEFTTRIWPFDMTHADPEAFLVNGFDASTWGAGSMPLERFLEKLQEVSKDAVIAGHGVNFDEGFLRAALEAHNLKPRWPYQSIDTQKMAWVLYMNNKISAVSLKNLAGYFGKTQPEPHRALADVILTHECFLAQLDLYSKAL